MAKLIATAIMSLDGYVADKSGRFDWAVPDEIVHTFINDLVRPIGIYLFGRRLYEVMASWETVSAQAGQPMYALDFAMIWRAAEKIVFSKTLESVSSAKTRIEREFNPEMVRKMKETSKRDLSVGGPTLAALAIKAGLVDEYHFFVVPIMVGGGNRFFPIDVHMKLTLLDELRFSNGMVHLHYGATPAVGPNAQVGRP
jgi:dihydrofolate reductase